MPRTIRSNPNSSSLHFSRFFALATSIVLIISQSFAAEPIRGRESAGAAPTNPAFVGALPSVREGGIGLRAAHPDDNYYEETKDKGYRFERGGWIYVHLEGSPYDIGYQHGYLLATEIADAFATVRLEMTHDTGRDWDFFRRTARTMLWHKIDNEYQFELKGIVDGLNAKGTKLDIDDIVAFLNTLTGTYRGAPVTAAKP